LTSRWIFPIETPPLERGTVTIDGAHIAAVEPRSCGAADLDLGDVAVLPGLINAHTHLDLSGLRGRLSPQADFIPWLRAVVQHRRGLSADQVEGDIRAGLAESLTHGTTLVGDVSGQGLSWPVLAAAPAWSVVFHEMLGLPRLRARQAWQDARSWCHSHSATPTCRPGLSPHAPYSVRASLFRAASSFTRRHHAPVAIHVAETPAELQLLSQHRGPFVEFLSELGAWDPRGLVRDPADVLRLFPRALFVHANYLDPSAPLSREATVIYCPRTHAAFGHPRHAFREFLKAGVRVALGTDSLASNPDLDVLAEARFVHARHPEVPGAVLLKMATLAGAEALGWARHTGSLRPGKSADLVVVPMAPGAAGDPHDRVLEASAPVRAVLWRGEWICGAPSPPGTAGTGRCT
jgi:cytosine/adenosine deaminase-related metal-dependent hydrolase